MSSVTRGCRSRRTTTRLLTSYLAQLTESRLEHALRLWIVTRGEGHFAMRVDTRIGCGTISSVSMQLIISWRRKQSRGLLAIATCCHDSCFHVLLCEADNSDQILLAKLSLKSLLPKKEIKYRAKLSTQLSCLIVPYVVRVAACIFISPLIGYRIYEACMK